MRREAAKISPGNEEVYFKQNQSNFLKLEEHIKIDRNLHNI